MSQFIGILLRFDGSAENDHISKYLGHLAIIRILRSDNQLASIHPFSIGAGDLLNLPPDEVRPFPNQSLVEILIILAKAADISKYLIDLGISLVFDKVSVLRHTCSILVSNSRETFIAAADTVDNGHASGDRAILELNITTSGTGGIA